MEWLFLTCHNHWIVCRLVKDDEHPYLVYSPKISIDDSSEAFRAFLGAILSVGEAVQVEPSTYNSNMQLDTIEEEENTDPLPEDDDSRLYSSISDRGATTCPPMTRSHGRDGDDKDKSKSKLLVCPVLSRYVFIGVYPLSGYFVFPNIA